MRAGIALVPVDRGNRDAGIRYRVRRQAGRAAGPQHDDRPVEGKLVQSGKLLPFGKGRSICRDGMQVPQVVPITITGTHAVIPAEGGFADQTGNSDGEISRHSD